MIYEHSGNFVFIFNKSVDIKFSAHDAFLESASSGTLNVGQVQFAEKVKSSGSLLVFGPT